MRSAMSIRILFYTISGTSLWKKNFGPSAVTPILVLPQWPHCEAYKFNLVGQFPYEGPLNALKIRRRRDLMSPCASIVVDAAWTLNIVAPTLLCHRFGAYEGRYTSPTLSTESLT